MKTQVKEYLDALPEERREAFLKLREVVQRSLPSGFEERMQYGMISYVVPNMMPELKAWFESEYPKHVKAKPDVGKSCIRFKNPKTIPFALIAELCQKVSVAGKKKPHHRGLEAREEENGVKNQYMKALKKIKK